METITSLNTELPPAEKPSRLGDVPFTDVDGKPIYLGNIIEQTNFNGEQYLAKYKVVIDPADNEVCLWMISGNEKAMSSEGYSSFGNIINGTLRKGRIIEQVAS